MHGRNFVGVVHLSWGIDVMEHAKKLRKIYVKLRPNVFASHVNIYTHRADSSLVLRFNSVIADK